MIISPNASQVCGIITTFQPDANFINHVDRLRSQVGLVVIVDDGGYNENLVFFHDIFTKMPNIVLHHNLTNMGIAASLNIGISIAKRLGYRWILMLDEDTFIYPNMAATLCDAWRAVERCGGPPVAVMGMSRLNEAKRSRIRLKYDSSIVVEKRGIITSGSLIKLDVFEAIGGFREEFFIDSVDYDYCLRAKARGFRIMKLYRIGMVHQLGNSRMHKIGPIKLETTHHSPLRRYYAIRNSSVLAREHFVRDPLYTFAVIFFHFKTLLLVLLLENDKLRKLIWMGRGLWDAWRNHLGKQNSVSKIK